MEPSKRTYLRYAGTATFVVFFMLTGLGLHEMGHALLVHQQGGTASITYGSTHGFLLWGATDYYGLDARAATIADAGAALAGLALAPVWLFARAMKIAEVEFSAGIVVFYQVFYGLAEIWYDSMGGGMVDVWSFGGLGLGIILLRGTLHDRQRGPSPTDTRLTTHAGHAQNDYAGYNRAP
jgi:hypothetical protein